jgi:hypothetical protein
MGRKRTGDMNMRTPITFLLAVAVLNSCNAVQPKPACKAQPAQYAAKYVLQGTAPAACEGKIVAAEVLNLQYYRSKLDDPNGVPSIAIEPQSVHDAVSEGEEAKVMVTSTEYSLGKYATSEPGDDDLCVAKSMSDTHIVIAEIPGDPMAVPPTETIEARDITYKWSNIKMMVTPLSNAVYFGADLTRIDGGCTATYKVTAVSPAVFCGDGVATVKDEMGNPKEEPDPTTGKPNQEACNATIQGTGLNQSLDYVCDATPDGMEGSHLCLVKGEFPALKK